MGVAPDLKAGDGEYSVSFADLRVGNDEITVKAGGDGTTVFTTAGATAKGTDRRDVVITAFRRTTSDTFKKGNYSGARDYAITFSSSKRRCLRARRSVPDTWRAEIGRISPLFPPAYPLVPGP